MCRMARAASPRRWITWWKPGKRIPRAAAAMSPAPEPRYDLLTLGEALLRLSPPGLQRIEQAQLLEIGVGGSELNVGCLLARLGRRVAWVSRLPTGPFGRIVDGEARRHRVDTHWIRWIENARLGLMFYEPGPEPRTSRVIYDRKHSAASELGFEDAPWEALVQASAWLHLSGITAALGPSCRALVLHLAALAAAAGKSVSYDLNYRATLTTATEARADPGSGCAASAPARPRRARRAERPRLPRRWRATRRCDLGALQGSRSSL